MIEPTTDDIGKGVVYTPNYKGAKKEDGVITGLSENPIFVFVKYKDQHPSAYGKSTPKVYLDWL